MTRRGARRRSTCRACARAPSAVALRARRAGAAAPSAQRQRRAGHAHRVPPVHRPEQPAVREHARAKASRTGSPTCSRKKLGLPVQNYAFPQRMNFIRNTLRYKLPGEDFRCDIVMGVPAGYDQVSATTPVLPLDLCAGVSEGQGPRPGAAPAPTCSRCRPSVRSKLTIGIYDRSPASAWLVKHGLEAQAKPYPMMSPDPEQYPGRDHREGPRAGQDRRRHRLGPDRRLLRQARAQRRTGRRSAEVGAGRQVRLRDRDGRALRRARMEGDRATSSSPRTRPRSRRSCASTTFRWSTSAASRSIAARTALARAECREGDPMRRRCLLLLTLLSVVPVAHANDFPTRARVEFVLACMSDSKAPPQESMYKCSCAIDAIADKVRLQRLGRSVDGRQRHHDRRRARRRHARPQGRPQADRVVPRAAGRAPRRQCFIRRVDARMRRCRCPSRSRMSARWSAWRWHSRSSVAAGAAAPTPRASRSRTRRRASTFITASWPR